jgi:DNA-binding LytR/AlgR family response regulator
MIRGSTEAPARSVARRPGREQRTQSGTEGTSSGTSGALALPPARALLALTVVIAGIDTVNVFSAIADANRYGRTLPAWQPAVWEATSGTATLLLSILVASALRLAPPTGTRVRRLVAVHAPAIIAFSLMHVALMRALRSGVYALLDERYDTPWDLLYEFRKDALSYVLIALIVWFASRKELPAATQSGEPTVTSEPTFDIVDGQATIRALPSSIRAAKAAGNYVEFHLGDGRRPLMRTPMQDVEARLAPFGFVRTHRSWLVNRAHVREIAKDGAGGAELTLDDGLVVPVSRRYAEARASLGC